MAEKALLGSADGVEPVEVQAASPNRTATAIRLRSAEGRVIAQE
jgi:hypothetical protein